MDNSFPLLREQLKPSGDVTTARAEAPIGITYDRSASDIGTPPGPPVKSEKHSPKHLMEKFLLLHYSEQHLDKSHTSNL